MTIETVYLSQKSKDQLLKVRRATGIQNWNILCRWAFCLSLKDGATPPAEEYSGEHAIEMTWKVFGGQDHDIYFALLRERCRKDQLLFDKDSLTKQLRAHLHRGIGSIANNKQLKIEDLFSMVAID